METRRGRRAWATRTTTVPEQQTEETLLNITTREELINALQEAIQVEHGLMLQYLFAAFSCKKFAEEEGLTPHQQERVRAWEGQILKVALDEMLHLGTACNLMHAIGGSPNFNRANFPQEVDKWLPFPYQLERLTPAVMDRFVRFEAPRWAIEQAARLAPIPIEYDYVGELYRSISVGFETVARNVDNLFVGSEVVQASSDWSRYPLSFSLFRLFGIRDVPSALEAIEFIIEQGEGLSGDIEGSHYEAFLKIRDEYAAEREADPTFDPARAVATNPLIRRHKDTDAEAEVSLIEEGTLAHDVADLFNNLYGTMLLMLFQFFDPAGETFQQRLALQTGTRRLMSMVIRPLGEVLTMLPIAEGTDRVAGATFETYAELRLPSFVPARWVILRERVQAGTRRCRELADRGDVGLERLAFLADNMDLFQKNLDDVIVHGRDAR